MLKLDDGNFVEYVHIEAGTNFSTQSRDLTPGSVELKEGDRVEEGQAVCRSGAVGFCPQPHLHIQMHASSADSAPTIPFAFRSPSGAIFAQLQV